MTSNFDFLAENWNFLQEDAQRVEAFALRDPRTAAFYARRTLERSLQWLYQNDTALKAPYEKNLAAMIYESTNHYKEVEYEEVEYDPPLVILDQLEALEAEIQGDLKALREMI